MKFYYRLFPTYKILNSLYVTYQRADELMRNTANNLDSEKWVLYTKKEDKNKVMGMVNICQRIRIYN